MRLSVIIPFYERLTEVLACLNSLQALSGYASHEYIIQDDASPTVLAPSVISPLLASVRRNETNLGFAGNVNAAAARATGDILFIVNQDVYGVYGLSDHWDGAILAPFADPTVGIVGAQLLFPDGRIQSAGGLFDAKCQPFHRCLGWSNRNHKLLCEGQAVSWTTGAALAIRRELFNRVGGMDTAYRMYFEDVGLCIKVQELGYKVWYEPRCALIHQAGTTGGSPYFMQSARQFKQEFVDTKRIAPDEPAVRERWW